MSEGTIVGDERIAVRTEALNWPDRARGLIVRDNATYTQGAELLRGVKALRQKIANTFDRHIAAAYGVHKGLVKEKADAEAPLTEAESIIKRALIAYTTEQDRLRRDEERRLAEEVRRREEEQRLAEAKAYEDAGLNAEAEEVLAQAMETPSPVVILPDATPKVEGLSYRVAWKAECISLKSLVAAAAHDDRLLGLVEPNTTALGQMARALREHMQVPGVRIWSEQVAAARIGVA
jgi:hypothetical protein